MKMRHISLFRLKPEYRAPEMVIAIAAQLRAIPKKLPTILDCEIGTKPLGGPDASPDGAVQFYDLIQIITFANEDDCAAYPASQSHADFLAFSQPYMEKVDVIDYPVE